MVTAAMGNGNSGQEGPVSLAEALRGTIRSERSQHEEDHRTGSMRPAGVQALGSGSHPALPKDCFSETKILFC